MSRVSQIISKARYTLADVEAQRWSNDRLLQLVNEAHEDIAIRTELIKASYNIYLRPGIANYDLPTDVWSIRRVTYNNSPLVLTSYDAIDSVTAGTLSAQTIGLATSVNWEADVGSPQAMLSNLRNLSDCRIYPIPESVGAAVDYNFISGTSIFRNFYSLRPVFGVISMADELGSMTDVFGITTSASTVVYVDGSPTDVPITDIDVYGIESVIVDQTTTLSTADGMLGVVTSVEDFVIGSVFGIVAAVQDTAVETVATDIFGVVTGVVEFEDYVRVQYVKSPAPLASVFSGLLTHPALDKAIEHYVVACAYRDDQDTRSVAKASEAFALYDRAIKSTTANSMQEGVKPAARITTYRAFE